MPDAVIDDASPRGLDIAEARLHDEVTELAVGEKALDVGVGGARLGRDRAHDRGESAPHGLPDLGDITRALGVDLERDEAAVADQGDVGRRHRVEHVGGARSVAVRRPLGHGGGDLRVAVVDRGHEEPELAVEETEHVSGRDARRGGDVGDGGGLVAGSGEHLHGGGEDPQPLRARP